jgi:pimeloyl-ACP methyl ester carboxylesterase
VLYRQFLFRIVDLEILSDHADLVKLLGQFAAMLAALSLMIAGGAFRITRSKAPPSEILVSAWVDEHSLIATTMAVVGLFAVLSWESALPNQRDVLVLAPLPVRIRTIFLAKLAAMGSALGLAVLVLNVFTGISYPIAIGLVKGGFLGVVRSFAAYWMTMLAATAFMFGGVLALQGIAAQVLSRQRFLRLSSYLQVAVVGLILAVYFLQPPLATPAALSTPANASLVMWLPSYWFVGLFQQLNGSPHEALGLLTAQAWLGLAVSVGVALIALLLSYSRTTRKLVEEPDIEPGRHRARWSPPLGGTLRTAIVHFCARTLSRSRQHRIILACYLGIGLALSMAYGRTLLYGYYGYTGYPWYEVNRPILVATVVMLCFAVVGMRVVFSMPTTLPANWIFQTAVARDAPEYLAGTRRTLLLLAVAPVWILSAVILLSIWPPWPVVGHMLLLGPLGFIITDLCLLRFDKIPFTCSYLPGKAQIHVTAAACILVLMSLTDLGVQFELYALQHPVRYVPLLALLLVIAALLRRRASEKMASPYTMLKFEETPPPAVLELGLQPDRALWQGNSPGLGVLPRNSIDTAGSGQPPRREPANFLHWTMRLGTATFALFAVLLLAGVAYQSVAGRLDLSKYPHPGRLIDVGGHRLHLHCTGGGSPTVVLESGGGSGMLAWRKVQPKVSRWTRVCSYDRAGFGWSELSSQPRTIRRVVEELRVLLDEGAIDGPLVLVGHSLGGVYAQFFAMTYPDAVAGVVLVDATHEETLERLPNYAGWVDGIVALTRKLRVAGVSRLFPQNADPTMRAFNNSNRHLDALGSEEEMVARNLAELKAVGVSLGDRPLIVLTSEQTNRFGFVQPLQEELAERSNRGKQIIVENSGHSIHIDQPEAVVAAIREVVEMTRSEQLGRSPEAEP